MRYGTKEIRNDYYSPIEGLYLNFDRATMSLAQTKTIIIAKQEIIVRIPTRDL